MRNVSKDTTQRPLHRRKRLKQKSQGHMIDVIYLPGKRKSKSQKGSQKTLKEIFPIEK